MAVGVKAGEKLHESAFELPAATTTVTPFAVAAPMLVSYNGSAPFPPRLILNTEGVKPLAVIQSMAECCHERAPEP
jgi:hypothetical protein